jgi:hypothetical protein
MPAPQPVALVIGDSVSLQWTPKARLQLCGSVIVQHEAGRLERDEPESPPKSCDKKDVDQKFDANNGCAASMLAVTLPRLDQWHYNIILLNAGLHDVQPNRVHWERGGILYDCGGPTPLDEYRASLERIAEYLQQHADAVVFVATTDVSEGNKSHIPVGAVEPYNKVMSDVAYKHGFYFLTFTVHAKKEDIHLSQKSSAIAADEAAMCIETVLQGATMSNCHVKPE